MTIPTIAIPNSANPSKRMPAVGLGTWLAPPGEVEQATYLALEQGFRHIDCASIYGNESEVGRGMKRWFDEGNSREDIWVTSKLWNNSHRPDRVEVALNKTLKDLQLTYLDLYLIHWPCPMKAGEVMIPRDDRPGRDGQNMPLVEPVTLNETWAAMEKLLQTGKTKNIGVSNSTKSEIVEGILATATHKPDVCQLEIHPHFRQTAYREWLHSQGIAVAAYSPYGNLNPIYEGKIGSEGRILDQPVICEIAAEIGLTPAQVVLSWGVTAGHAVLPKSTNAGRLRENVGVQILSDKHMNAIESIDVNTRYNDMKGKFGYVTFQEDKDEETFKSEIWSPEYPQASARARTSANKSASAGPGPSTRIGNGTLNPAVNGARTAVAV